MSVLPKTIGLNKLEIVSIKDVEGVKKYLTRMIDTLDLFYRLLRTDTTGDTAAETSNWRLREANQSDVDNEEADAVGNLIVEHKTNGARHEFEA